MAKKSMMEHAFKELVDLSKQFWQMSFVATVLFIALTSLAVKFSTGVLNNVSNPSPIHEALIGSIGWVFYLLPALFGIITVFFGMTALKGYLESKYT
ncbi:TPA: hypothetical protein NJ005_004734 [Vibrio parahaemolyticus]|nr:hypothetical protein [Vibrio parahaemolyticus]